MCGLIESNLDLCRVPENETEVVLSEASAFIRQVSARELQPWTIAFFDPPYANDYLSVLELFGADNLKLLTESGLLIVEHHHKNALKDQIGDIIRTRIIKQGDSSLSFFQKP
jgi:16S rRNA G966 N2-methylase RsmD